MTNGIRSTLDVIGIDEHRVQQLTSGTSKPAENENSLFVVTRGDKFLGHQIHAVMQGRDDAEISSAIVADNFVVVHMPLQKHNGLPSARLETPVDSFRLGLNISQQVVITLDMGATGSTDLHEDKLALISRAFFQHAFDCQKPFQDSFGVIDAI